MFPKNLPKTKRCQTLMQQISALADRYLDTYPESLPYTLFCEFAETGERGGYEAKYFDHRRRLNSVFFTYLYTKEKKYFSALIDAIAAILDEYTWAVPAHVNGRDLSSTIGKIDLFSAETVYALAEIDAILGEELPSRIRERIRYEAKRRILDTFFACTERYPCSNWSAVQGAGIAAALVRLFPECLDEGLPILLPIMQNFLDSYREDGCCMEGTLYWIYGFGFYTYGAQLLREGTGGRVDLFQNPKVERMAHFFENVTFKNGSVVPFADSPLQCKMRVGLACFLHHEFGVELPDSELLFGVHDDERFRFADILHDLYWGEDFDTAGAVRLGEFYYPDSQWYIYRTEGMSYAAKGGHNKEPHNHNDVGGFVLFDGEKTVLGDLGWEEYVRTYFGERRYLDFLLTPSTGHSVPVIDTRAQIVTDEQATVTEASGGVFALDMGAAYGVGHFLRRFEQKGNRLSVTDSSQLPFTERFITSYRPEYENGVLTVGGVRVSVDCPHEVKITEHTYRPRRLICGEHLKEYETAYIVEIVACERGGQLTMTFEK